MILRKKKKKKHIFTYRKLLEMGLEDTKTNQQLYKQGKDLDLIIKLPIEENHEN